MSASHVIDASAIVAMLCGEPLAQSVEEALDSSRKAISPDYVLVECANVAWKRYMRDDLSMDEAAVRIRAVEESPIGLHKTPPLLPRALLTAMRTRHPLYDCVYIALAEQEGADLITADARQAEAARSAGVRVVLLGGE